jgi:hypothetical protein
LSDGTVQDHMGASDPRLTESGGLHAGIELIAVSRGELPEWHLTEGGLEVAFGHAHPVSAGGGSECRRGQELVQQVPEGDTATSIKAAARVHDHTLQGVLGLRSRAVNRA